MRIATIALPFCAAVLLAACGKDEPASSAPTAASPSDAPAASAPPPPSAPAPSANSVGVAECDDFLTKYEACLADHVPESARAALQQSLNATRAGWVQAAATPAGRDSLKAACEQMRTTSRQSLQAYGCSDL